MYKIHGELGSADMQQIEDDLPKLQAKIAEYDPRDLYNMAETAILYCNPEQQRLRRVP